MRFTIKRFAAPIRPRVLYRVPDRQVPRARHVAAGRTLHLVDIENLVGGSSAVCGALETVSVEYRRIASVVAGDHVIVASGRKMIVAAGLAWPGARLVMGRGVHGADRALLAEVVDAEWVAARFDRVVLGSGDSIFTEALASFRALGIATGIVAPACSISWVLRRQAGFVRTIDCPHATEGVA